MILISDEFKYIHINVFITCNIEHNKQMFQYNLAAPYTIHVPLYPVVVNFSSGNIKNKEY
jgi:hypothetical protein